MLKITEHQGRWFAFWVVVGFVALIEGCAIDSEGAQGFWETNSTMTSNQPWLPIGPTNQLGPSMVARFHIINPAPGYVILAGGIISNCISSFTMSNGIPVFYYSLGAQFAAFTNAISKNPSNGIFKVVK